LRLDDPPSALNQIEDEDDQSGDQQNVDKTAQGVGREETQEPKNAQQHNNCPKHIFPFLPKREPEALAST